MTGLVQNLQGISKTLSKHYSTDWQTIC